MSQCCTLLKCPAEFLLPAPSFHLVAPLVCASEHNCCVLSQPVLGVGDNSLREQECGICQSQMSWLASCDKYLQEFKKKRIQGYRFKVRGGDGKQFPPNKGDLKNVYILSCCTVSSNVQGRKELKEERGWCAVVEMCSLSADPWGYAVQLVRRKNVAGQM